MEDEGGGEVLEEQVTNIIPTRATPPPPDDRRERRDREDCFGIPRPWFLPFIGVAIVLFGIFTLLEAYIPNLPSAWPLILIIFGVLIIVAAISRPRH